MHTKYINLRFHIDDILVSKVGPIYIRGSKGYTFNIDIDHLSIFKVND